MEEIKASFRDSKDIEVTMFGKNSAIAKPTSARNIFGFMGLKNQGATCYLNSLLQSMYMTPELRNWLLSLDPTSLGVEYMVEGESEGQSNESIESFEMNEVLFGELLNFGVTEPIARQALELTKNSSIEDALDMVQKLNADLEFNETRKRRISKPRYIPLELQKLFAKMKLLDQDSISTEDLTKRGFQWQNFDGGVQHDAHELNRLLIEALEKSLKNTLGAELCKSLYQGILSYRTSCQKCNYTSIRREGFYDLNLQVNSYTDLIQSLRAYFAYETLDGDSRYFCEKCSSKQPAIRYSNVENLPPVLTFSLNRFRIDKSTNWRRQKLVSYYSFPLIYNFTLSNLDEELMPLSPDNDEISLRNKDRGLWIENVASIALKLAMKLINDNTDVNFEINGLDEPTKMHLDESILANFARDISNDNCNIYQLSSVIMHSGSAYSGHYFAYIRDNSNEGDWHLHDSEFENANYCSLKNSRRSSKVNRSQFDGDGKSNSASDYIFHGEAVYVLKISIIGVVLQSCKLMEGNSTIKQVLTECNKVFRSQGNDKLDESKLEKIINEHSLFFEGINKKRMIILKSLVSSISFVDNEKFSEIQRKDSQQLQNMNIFHFGNQESRISSNNDISLSSTSLLCDDRAIAQALQDEEYGHVGRRKRRVKNESYPFIPAADDGNQNTQIHPIYENTALSTRQRKFAESILQYYFGKYFEFNDAYIRPILLKDIGRAFDGSDSAYLLVYRKISMDQIPRLSNPFQNITNSDYNRDNLRSHNYWIKHVENLNSLAKEHRLQYSSGLHDVTVKILLPLNVQFSNPLIYHSKKFHSFLPFDLQNGIVISFDERLTLDDLYEKIAKEFEVFKYLGDNQSESLQPKITQKLFFSPIYHCAKYPDTLGFEIGDELSGAKSISEIIQSHGKIAKRVAYFLLWNGLSLPKVDRISKLIIYKEVSLFQPLHSIPTRLLTVAEIQASGFPIAFLQPECKYSNISHHVSESKTLVFSGTTTIEEFCEMMCDSYNVCHENAIISVLSLPGYKFKAANPNSKNANKQSHKTQNFSSGSLINIWNRNLSSDFNSLSILSDIPHLFEVFIESFDADLATSLADCELLRRKQLVTINFVNFVDFQLSKDSNTTDNLIQKSQNAKEIQLKVDRSIHLRFIKESLIRYFDISVSHESVGFSLNEHVIDNEEVTVEDTQIISGESIQLVIINDIHPSEYRDLIVNLISMDDSAEGYITNPEAFSIIDTITLSVTLNDLIIDVKERAGLAFQSLQLKRGWAKLLIDQITAPQVDKPIFVYEESISKYRFHEMIAGKIQKVGKILSEGVEVYEADNRQFIFFKLVDVLTLVKKKGNLSLYFSSGLPSIQNRHYLKLYLWKEGYFNNIVPCDADDHKPVSLSNNNEDFCHLFKEEDEIQFLSAEQVLEIKKTQLQSLYTNTRNQSLQFILDLPVHEETSFEDLKKQVHSIITSYVKSYLRLNEEDQFECPSLDNMFLRELQSNYLPGKCVGSQVIKNETKQMSSTHFDDLNLLSLLSLGLFKREAKKTSKSIPSLMQSKTVNIVIEFVEDSSKSCSTSIWCQQLINAYTEECCNNAIMSPNWPPKRIFYDPCTDLTMEKLKNKIIEAFDWDGIKPSVDSISIYRFNGLKFVWNEISYSNEKVVGKRKHNGTMMLDIQEGDQICVFKSEENYSNQQIEISRIEDGIERFLLENKKKTKNKSFMSSNLQSEKREAQLNLGGNFDFSDCDSDDEIEIVDQNSVFD